MTSCDQRSIGLRASVGEAMSRRAALAMMAALPLSARAQGAAPEPVRDTLTTSTGGSVPLWRWVGRGAGVIAFSHGAASAPWKYPGMIGPWTAAGYDVLAPLHADSPDHPDHAKTPGMATWKARLEDMRAVSRHINGPYIAAGHSYGALTALVMGGAEAHRPEGIAGPLRDPNAVCAVAFSPPPPIAGLIEAPGYAALAVPALVETGTHDIPPGAADKVEGWKEHLAAFDAAAPGHHRYALVLQDVNHYFGGAICDFAQPGPPQTAQLASAVDLSLAFMADWGGSGPQGQVRLTSHLTDQGPVRLIVR